MLIFRFNLSGIHTKLSHINSFHFCSCLCSLPNLIYVVLRCSARCPDGPNMFFLSWWGTQSLCRGSDSLSLEAVARNRDFPWLWPARCSCSQQLAQNSCFISKSTLDVPESLARIWQCKYHSWLAVDFKIVPNKQEGDMLLLQISMRCCRDRWQQGWPWGPSPLGAQVPRTCHLEHWGFPYYVDSVCKPTETQTLHGKQPGTPWFR